MLNRYVMGNRLNKKHVHTEILSIWLHNYNIANKS